MRIIKDTNVLVSALRSGAGASRRLLRLLLAHKHSPLISDKLWLEYQDVAGRGDEVWRESASSKEDRQQAVEDFATVCE